jgi:hypothetical protein
MIYSNLIAASGGAIGNISGIGNIGLVSGPSSAVDIFAKVLSSVIGLLTVIAAIIFMFNILTGAISIISAGGDKGAVEEGRKKITNAVIGFTLTIAAMFIIDLVTLILGIPNFLDIGNIITAITVK